ncbi:MAG TPA: hypothetical protein VGM63_09845 [Mucilaginibacter sp.]
MKKLAIISAIALSGLLYNSANAQIRIHVGLHFNPRPIYVPARVVVQDQPVAYTEPANYDGDEDYYYLPDVDSYYSVTDQCYYYNDGNSWVSAAYLPGAYRDFDWRNARRFEVRASRPFMHNDYYRARYNGVAFNGHWDRGYNPGNAAVNHSNHNQFRNDDHRFDNNRRGNDQRMQPSHNFDRVGAQEHFAQNNPQRGGRDNHRSGRF